MVSLQDLLPALPPPFRSFPLRAWALTSLSQVNFCVNQGLVVVVVVVVMMMRTRLVLVVVVGAERRRWEVEGGCR
jgi:hypothetical protein